MTHIFCVVSGAFPPTPPQKRAKVINKAVYGYATVVLVPGTVYGYRIIPVWGTT